MTHVVEADSGASGNTRKLSLNKWRRQSGVTIKLGNLMRRREPAHLGLARGNCQWPTWSRFG